MTPDLDRPAHDDREQSDLDVITEADVLPDNDAAERQAYTAADAVAEQMPIRPDLESARHPSEEDEVLEGNSLFRNHSAR